MLKLTGRVQFELSAAKILVPQVSQCLHRWQHSIWTCIIVAIISCTGWARDPLCPSVFRDTTPYLDPSWMHFQFSFSNALTETHDVLWEYFPDCFLRGVNDFISLPQIFASSSKFLPCLTISYTTTFEVTASKEYMQSLGTALLASYECRHNFVYNHNATSTFLANCTDFFEGIIGH